MAVYRREKKGNLYYYKVETKEVVPIDIRDVFNTFMACVCGSAYSEHWTEYVFVSVHKKEDYTNLKNFRETVSMSCLSKLLEYYEYSR